MKKVTIDWIQVPTSELRKYKDSSFYTFSRAGKVVYIGISYRQNVFDEIQNTIRRLKINTIGLTYFVGYINRENTTFERITERHVYDFECLLIYKNQPFYNIMCKQNYGKRLNYRIVSRGNSSLIHRISVDENGNFRNT